MPISSSGTPVTIGSDQPMSFDDQMKIMPPMVTDAKRSIGP